MPEFRAEICLALAPTITTRLDETPVVACYPAKCSNFTRDYLSSAIKIGALPHGHCSSLPVPSAERPAKEEI